MNCSYMKSKDPNRDDWIAVILDPTQPDRSIPYLEAIREVAANVMKDLIDAKDAENATVHFDFVVTVIDTIHKLENMKKEGS